MPGTLACHSLGEAAENAAGPQGLNSARRSYQLLAIGQTLVSWRLHLQELERFGVGELIGLPRRRKSRRSE
jgi:hypothetical protein